MRFAWRAVVCEDLLRHYGTPFIPSAFSHYSYTQSLCCPGMFIAETCFTLIGIQCFCALANSF